jgi:predicted amidohydrolase YtcJ
MSADLVIRGGTVFDGTGASGRAADVAIAEGVIREIGPKLQGTRELDASGCAVAPGFIDIHTHDDRALLSGLTKTKVTATWVPWTETRLAAASGYGAGVISPGWYAHLWEQLQHPDSQTRALSVDVFASRWQAGVASLLRRNGRPASTASVSRTTASRTRVRSPRRK